MTGEPLDLNALRALTLRQWRTWATDAGMFESYKIWEPLRELFAARGIDMFVPCYPGPENAGYVKGHDNSPRPYDGSYHALKGDVKIKSQHYVSQTVISCLLDLPTFPRHDRNRHTALLAGAKASVMFSFA